jgi:hypothetical protein
MSGDFVCQDDFMTKILSDLLSMKNILNNIQADLFGVTVNGISRVDYGRRRVSQPPVSRSPSPNRACAFRYALGSPETIA